MWHMTSHDRNRRNWERYFSLQSINGSFCYMFFAHELFAKVHVHLQQLHLFTVVFNQTWDSCRCLENILSDSKSVDISDLIVSELTLIGPTLCNCLQLKKTHLISGFRFSILGVPFMTISDTNSKYLNP